MTQPALKPDAFVVAVDIGGTKVAAAILSVHGDILAETIEPTNQEGPRAGIEQIIRVVEKLIEKFSLSRESLLGIGIGIPAVLEPETDFILWGPNLKDWWDVDLRGALERHFQRPVCIEYDGHTAVLGEWWMGAGKGHRSIVSVIIGTGVGGGMVLEGNLIRGVNRLAGAVGWFVMDPPAEGDAEKERSLGSWEARIAGPGIARRAKQLLESLDVIQSELAKVGPEPTAAQVFAAAKRGDALALQIVAEEAELMGMGIANIVSTVNPEIIVLGGSVGANAEFLLPAVTETVARCAQPFSAKSVQIVTSRLGTKAGLYGAAYGFLLRHPQYLSVP